MTTTEVTAGQLPLLRPGLNPTSGMGMARLRDRVDLEVANLKEATEVIVKNHYLHRGRTMAQLPYWILFDGERVGVLLYSYARMSVAYQGFKPMNILELARMWLNPRVQGIRVVDSRGRECALSVASCAIGKSLRRIQADWHGKYPHLPDILTVVSWADTEHHEGVIYRAANFQEVGTSGGSLHGSTYRRNGGHDQLNADYLHVKKAFIYPFKGAMRESEKRRARERWALLSKHVQRVVANKVSKLEGRIAPELDPVRSDVGPRNLGVVQSQTPIPELA